MEFQERQKNNNNLNAGYTSANNMPERKTIRGGGGKK